MFYFVKFTEWIYVGRQDIFQPGSHGTKLNFLALSYQCLLSVLKFRSDEGLTLETSAFQIFHGGNFTFINSFDKTKVFF